MAAVLDQLTMARWDRLISADFRMGGDGCRQEKYEGSTMFAVCRIWISLLLPFEPNKRTRDTVVGRERLPRSIPIPTNTRIRILRTVHTSCLCAALSAKLAGLGPV